MGYDAPLPFVPIVVGVGCGLGGGPLAGPSPWDPLLISPWWGRGMARGRGDTLLVVGGGLGGGRGGSRTAPTGWVKGEGGLLWLGVLR